MPARRRSSARRRVAGRSRRRGVPAWFWLLGGILIGLGGAVVLVFKGYLPTMKEHHPTADKQVTAPAETELAGDKKGVAEQPKKPRYDFFTVLPEMDVVVPEQELSRQAEPGTEKQAGSGQDTYILQAGSFRDAADAEQLKARLALLGAQADIQAVTVNGETWHRVRIGPLKGARKADELRRMLDENRIATLVLKASP